MTLTFLRRWAALCTAAIALSTNAAPVVTQPGTAQGLRYGTPSGVEPSPLDQVPPEVLNKLRGGSPAVLRERGLELKRRLDARPGDPFLMHALATVLFHEGSTREARGLWSAAAQREPNLASADLMTAVQTLQVQLASNDPAAAKAQLSAIERRFGADPHFHLARAEQAMRGGNPTAAEAAYRRANELGPKLWVTRLNLARFVDRGLHDVAQAQRLYHEATVLAPQRPEPWHHLATFQARQSQDAAALESLRRVKALDPAAASPERRLAEMSAALGRYGDAHRWYTAALAANPPKDEALALRVGLGDVLMRLDRPAEARAQMEAVLKDQWLAPLAFAIGTLDEAERRWPAAEKRYREVLQKMPGHPLAANNLAMLLVKTGKNPAQALKLAGQARLSLPDNAIVEGTWGCALVENRRAAEAVPVLTQVLKARPDGDPWAHYCIGKALLEQGREAEGQAHLKKALSVDERFDRRDEVIRLLKSRG